MGRVVDTSTVPPRERFDFWLAESSEVFYPVNISRLARRPFAGRISEYPLGLVRIVRTAGDPSMLHRTQRTIRVSDPEAFTFAIQLRGRTTLRQGGRVASLRVGDITSLDSSFPYSLTSCERFEWLQVVVPRPLFRQEADLMSGLAGSCISSSGGLGALTAGFLYRVADGLKTGAISERNFDVADCVLSLIRGLYNEHGLTEAAQATRSPELRRLEVRRFIETRIGDPALCPEVIAHAHGMSTRQLHRLFETEAETIGEHIRELRLEHCRRDLVNPDLGSESIYAIAVRWGFASPSHFSRLFRNRYGCSAREYRSGGEDGHGLESGLPVSSDPGSGPKLSRGGRAISASVRSDHRVGA